MKNLVSIIIITAFLLSCGIIEPTPGEWHNMGLEGKLVGTLHIIDNYLYACAGNNGLYRLNLKTWGSNWKYLGLADSLVEFTLQYGVTDVVSVNGNLLVSYGAGYKRQKNGIYYSSNNGKTWVESDSGMTISQPYPTTSQVTCLEQHPDNPEIIFAGTGIGFIYRSDDGGKYWSKVYGDVAMGQLTHVIRFNKSNFNELWIGGETGRFAPFVLYSENMGESWIDTLPFLQNLSIASNDNSVYDIRIDSGNDSILYFGLHGDLIKTADKGHTYHYLLDDDNAIYEFLGISINPNDSNEIFAIGGYLYRSINGGETWQKVSSPDETTLFYALEVDWQNKVIYASGMGEKRGVYKYYF